MQNIINYLNNLHLKRIYNYIKLKKYSIDTIVDIGAYEGDFAQLFVNDKSIKNIYCFEPQIDKYNYLTCELTSQQKLINKILNSFNSHNTIYNNLPDILNKPNIEFIKIVDDLERCIWKYSNFQHLVIYGSINSNKEQFVNLLLENIYGKNNIELKDVEYTINGYGNTKTKVNIKQSKYHIVIEPNSNGFDKYLIQEIIQYYAKTQLLNILKYKKLFKIVVINKLDNLSYYAQAALRRTM